MIKSIFLTFFLTLSFSFVQAQHEDFQIISQVLEELENRDWLLEDIFPRMPPPPESREYFIELRDDLTQDQADSLFTRIENRYAQYLREVAERQVDSTVIYLATDNNLSGSKCIWCGIKPDSLLNDPSYSRYQKLAKQLIKGKKKDLRIPFDSLFYYGKYNLKSVDEFPPRNELYKGNLNFLSGGEIYFSRFYQDENLGTIYFSINTCKSDCGSGYMVLYERKEGKWQIFDILLQWIN
jgi:hypothetical protein